jgi:hypothetical protein
VSGCQKLLLVLLILLPVVVVCCNWSDGARSKAGHLVVIKGYIVEAT